MSIASCSSLLNVVKENAGEAPKTPGSVTSETPSSPTLRESAAPLSRGAPSSEPRPTPLATRRLPETMGYELFLDGRRTDYQPAWDAGQAMESYRRNQATYPKANISAKFDGQDITEVSSISILPVFFIAAGQKDPSEKERQDLSTHLSLAQRRYSEILNFRDTFSIAPEPPVIYHSSNELDYFRRSSDEGGTKYTVELLDRLKKSRFSAPYAFLIIVMNSCDKFPTAGGRPINGGFNRGPGIMIMNNSELTTVSGHFQSTLQHEIGHSFGLVHVDAYGYDIESNASIMSYNLTHHWRGLEKPPVQGVLIPEDLRSLANNKQALPKFNFISAKDVPPGYILKDQVEMTAMDFYAAWEGYRLYVEGQLVEKESEWTSYQAIKNLLAAKDRHPGKSVEGKYGDKPITISRQGYELYFRGERVGHEPTWTSAQGAENLKWNREQQPCGEVSGLHNGRILPEPG